VYDIYIDSRWYRIEVLGEKMARVVANSEKRRGAYFTPRPIAQFLADWAIRSPSESVLEPSCGEAVFLEAAGRRLDILSHANDRTAENLHGIEVHEPSATRAAERLLQLGYRATIECRDMFDVEPVARHDVVLGNPPFIRYQSFSGDARAKGLQAALAQGVSLRRLSSAWAACLIHASAFLNESGRLGFVLPAELLSTHYAAEVRSFLLRRFGSLKIVVFEQLVFPGVMEEVILLLAEGVGGCKSFEVIQFKNMDCLSTAALRGSGYMPSHPGHKWTTALLHQEAQEILSGLTNSRNFEPLGDWGSVYLGFVTGNNDYFVLNELQRRALGISERDVLKICPPGARRLSGLALTDATWASMRDQDAGTYLFYPRSSNLSDSAKAYIRQGIRDKVNTGYKCTNRDPWWRVPILPEPDVIFTYMNHHMPRLISNEASVQVSNSVYGISLHRNRKRIGRATLPALFFNSVSALSSEVEGRSYGGGLLKHEPREADKILVPSLSLVAHMIDELDKWKVPLTQLMAEAKHQQACETIDSVLFDAFSMPEEALKIVRRARTDFLGRRISRSKSFVEA
jgi:adenine-specific DNA methylase